MPRNGSGSYSLVAGNPVVTGTTISSTWANNTLSDIATALTQSIAKDGQTTPTANLPMGGFKHTGAAVAAATTDYARADQVQNSSLQWLSTVAGTDTITASASLSLAAYAAGQTFRFVAAGANTGAATLNVNSIGAKSITKNGTTALAAGDIPSGAVITVTYDGTQFQLSAVQKALGTAAFLNVGTSANNVVQLDGSAKLPAVDGSQLTNLTPSPGAIYGLTGSSAGGTTLTVAAGYATDSTNTVLMNLASSMAKTNAAWSAGTGNGGLDTGSIATATWYHWYLIRNPSSGAVDLVFSTNASSPTLPSGYTQYRRIFTWRYTGGGIWEQLVQNENEFLWPASIIDLDAVNPGTSAATRTLTVPTGITVEAIISVGCFYGSSAFTALVSPLSINDQAPQASGTGALTGFSNSSSPTNTAGWNFFPLRVRTNTSGQVRCRLSASGASDRLGIITFGWIDTRGQ